MVCAFWNLNQVIQGSPTKALYVLSPYTIEISITSLRPRDCTCWSVDLDSAKYGRRSDVIGSLDIHHIACSHLINTCVVLLDIDCLCTIRVSSIQIRANYSLRRVQIPSTRNTAMVTRATGLQRSQYLFVSGVRVRQIRHHRSSDAEPWKRI